MDWQRFIIVGENIHCTRVVKREGAKTRQLADGRLGVTFKSQGQERALPVPADWATVSPPFHDGKIKHVALAIHQLLHGQGDDRAAGEAYLAYLADRQVRAGASYLDVNVDEYSADPAVAADVLARVVDFLGARVGVPLSIDSSNPEILRAGLRRCRKDIRAPMINSVSLERAEVVDLVCEFGADAIVNACGRTGMPAGVEDRLANLREIIGLLDKAGVARGQMHLDPLVLPISTDPLNGSYFLQATAAARREFAGVHLNGGLSNVSFGMPNRGLLNSTFVWLCAEAGTDGGIIDPVTLPVSAMAQVDTGAEPFRLARAVLVGEDLYGADYISAFREGKLGGGAPA